MTNEIRFSADNSREYRLTPDQFRKLGLEVDYAEVNKAQLQLGDQVAGYIHIPEDPATTRGLCEVVDMIGKRLALITMKQAFSF